MRHLVYNIRFSVVPINSSLWTTTLYSSVITTLVYNEAKCSVCFWRDSFQWAMVSSFTRFLDHTQWRTTVGRTPLDEWSARRRDHYLTTHNTQTHIHAPVGFEPTIPAGERPQTYALDRAATGTGHKIFIPLHNVITSFDYAVTR